MIAFHNDHLVSREFCKLMYDTIPEELHVPIVFVPCTKEYKIQGRTDGYFVWLHLQSIYYHGRAGGDFGIWKSLLQVAYHEFGHMATYPKMDSVLWARYEYDYDCKSKIEAVAEKWADMMIDRLADFDKRLAQPGRLGKYFDGRIVKTKRGGYNSLTTWRKFKSGGQVSITEMAIAIGAVKHDTDFTFKSDTRIVRKLSEDLAYHYTDRAGRDLLFFAWGDIHEIKRRFERYKAAG